MGDRPLSQGQLDALARSRGFHDYATWAAYHQKYQTQGQNPTVQGAPKNWFQRAVEAIPGHPAQLFNYVSDRYAKATGQKP